MAAAPEPNVEVTRLMRAGDWRAALRCTDDALRLAANNPVFLLNRAQCLLALGELSKAIEAADGAQRHASGNAALLDALGTLYSRANDQRRALAAYDAALALAPANPQVIFNRAAVRRFLGQLGEAEVDYDRVIALNPRDYEAYRNRSELRTQTAERNHVAELERLVAAGIADWRAELQLRYALAKEYEDLHEYDKSFRQLQRGARLRRDHLRYDVANDVATVDWIIEAFPAAPAGPTPGTCADAPIFIVGLPRSGSTLVDRILGSHSQVRSAGELNCFALALVDAARRDSGNAPLSRREQVARSARVDFAALGRDYLERARAAGAAGASAAAQAAGPQGAARVRFTDKMPLNYLYCGLILRALPNAKIVHVSRSPMASCYAIYKTLFEDGYPFSYDLAELGQYYVGYRRLMAHWSASMPGAIYPLRYEDLVADQIGQTRALLQFCGLPWEEACAQFHQNPAPTTTASAAQVRRPIYDSSLAQWRHYEQQLAPLSSQLSAAGIRAQE
jgi:tetratricopeptide (TPR) repeat protein